MKICAVAACAALAAFSTGAAVRADVINFQRTPLTNIIAQLNQRYNIHIVLKGATATRPNRLLSFSFGDPAQTTDRQQAISALASAANAGFQKGFVVSKVAAGEAVPDVPIDTNGYVIFKEKTVPVAEAITTVAGTDNATSQVADDVTGTVTFSDTTLRSTEAAKEIAEQTHTVWRVYYALEPEAMLAASPQPNLYFDVNPPAQTTDDQANAPGNPASGPMSMQNAPYPYTAPMASPYAYGGYPYGYGASPYAAASPYGYGASPYGYGGSPYGYAASPYGYGGSPYGYGGYGTGVNVLPSYGGYGPFGGYGGPPISF